MSRRRAPLAVPVKLNGSGAAEVSRAMNLPTQMTPGVGALMARSSPTRSSALWGMRLAQRGAWTSTARVQLLSKSPPARGVGTGLAAGAAVPALGSCATTGGQGVQDRVKYCDVAPLCGCCSVR